jgi:hypothetical protein
MKLLYYCIILNVFIISSLDAQCPTEFLHLKNQAQIDSFAILYPNCKSVDATLYIQPDSPETDDITNLNAFAGLDSILDLTVRKCNLLKEVKINETVNITHLAVSSCLLLESVQVMNNLNSGSWLYISDLPSFNESVVYNIDTLSVLTVDEIPVASLDFLGDIKDVKIRVNLTDNAILNDISKLGDFNTTKFRFRNNPNLSVCTIDAVCRAIGVDIDNVEISYNGMGCTDEFDVFYNCFPDSESCVFTELTLRNQSDLDKLSLLPDPCIDSIRSITIDGYLDVSDPIKDLSNLQRFKELDKLQITANSQLISLNGLDSLVSVRELNLWDNSRIKSLEGMGSLRIAKEITIRSMDSLVSLSNVDFSLSTCNSLEIQNSGVKDLSALSTLDSITSVFLYDTPINDMSWASDVQKIDLIHLTSNDSITEFSFTNGPLIGDLILEDNNSLSEIVGITFQDIVGQIEISNNPVSNLSIISGPKQVTSFIELRNSNLVEMPAWVGVDEVGDIFISGNNVLEGIEFLEGFSKIRNLVISDNEVLTHMGTSAIDLTYIKHLSIQRNSMLSDVSVFDHDFTIDRITIRDNPSLSTCDALAICKEYKSIYPDISLDGNGDKCNLVDLNFECDYGNNAYGNVVVKSQEDIDSVKQWFPQMDSVFGNLVIDFSLNLEGADFSFFDNIQFVRDRLEIRYPKKDGVFEMFEGIEVSGLLLVGLETASLDIINYKDELSIFRLTSVQGLDDFKGLENVKEIREVDIVDCPISSTDGLDSLTQTIYFQIVDCPLLEDVSALKNLELTRDFRLAVLPKLTGLAVFDSLKVLSELQLNSIPLMTEVPDFDVGNTLSIFYLLRNDGITEMIFDSLQISHQYFFISSNPNLKRVSFASLKEVSTFAISNNESLEQISFPSLLEASSSLAIRNNTTIEDISGINSGALTPNLEIHDNVSLQNCNVELICNNINAGASIRIENNLACQSIDDVLPLCITAIDDVQDNPVKIYPNPTTGLIEIIGDVEFNTMQLFNNFGQLMKLSRDGSKVKITDHNPGLYFLKYKSGANWYVQKIIKI